MPFVFVADTFHPAKLMIFCAVKSTLTLFNLFLFGANGIKFDLDSCLTP
jgi:hypothetical protein